MGRRIIAGLGLAVLLAVVLSLFAFGGDGLDRSALLMIGVLSLAAVLLVVGGLVETVPFGSVTVQWYHSVGAGIVLVGLANLVFGAQRAVESGGLSAEVVVSAAGGLLIVFIGVDFLRGGVHHDLSKLE